MGDASKPNGNERTPMPIVGISAQHDRDPERFSLLAEYVRFLGGLGAGALIIPAVASAAEADDVLCRIDGLVVPGGDDDIDPARYGQARRTPTSDPNPARDESEALLIEGAARLDMPFLGICRGMQMANVAFGGTLFQDVEAQHPDSVLHWQTQPYGQPSHLVEVVAETPLARTVGYTEMAVNSMHRQGVDQLGRGLAAMAHAEGGFVEALFRPESTFFWGVQWHPELIPETDASQAIGRAFASACASFRLKAGTR